MPWREICRGVCCWPWFRGPVVLVLAVLILSAFPSLAKEGSCSPAIISVGRREKVFPAELCHVGISSWERTQGRGWKWG